MLDFGKDHSETVTKHQDSLNENASSSNSNSLADDNINKKIITTIDSIAVAKSTDIVYDSTDSVTKRSFFQNSLLRIKSLYRWFKRHFRTLSHIFLGCFFTSYWLSLLIQDDKRHEWLVRTIIYLMIMARLITWHTSIVHVAFNNCCEIWNYVTGIIYKKISNSNVRLLLGTTITLAVMMLGTFVPSETEYSKRYDRAISFLGIVVAIACLYISSANRSKIQWHTIITGMLMQFIVALFVLRTKCGYDIFKFISSLATSLLGFAKDGVAFLTNTTVSHEGMFFFTVLPSVIFFAAFIHIWYYVGFIQWALKKFAKFFWWTLRISGAESINAAASPFIGIGESAILIKTLMPYLTKAEIHQIMCSGFATISGSVLVSYIGLGLNPQALVSSCIMSIPCAIALSKIRYPETEVSLSASKVEIPEAHDEEDELNKPRNILQAFSQGATLGLKIALTIMTQCLCIIALVALINGILTYFGKIWNIKELTLELIFSYLLYPVAFLLGTPREDILKVSKLIAVKIIQNEYNGYSLLISDPRYNSMNIKSKLIATYSLCGFANFGSVGTQIGVLGTLAPTRLKDISQLVMSSLITGCIATLVSTCVAAMVIHDLSNFTVS